MMATLTGPIGTPVNAPTAAPMRNRLSTLEDRGYNSNVDASVTWIGHASALVDLGGERVLIDPLGRRRCRVASEYRAILITHAHVDHLNRWTLSALDRSARIVVPKGAGRSVRALGFAQ